MILYNVTVNIEPSIHQEWLQWMQEVHVPEVLQTGLFVEHKILRLLQETENNGFTYAFQYYLRSMADLERYQREYAPALQAAHKARYKDQFVAFRTVLEVVA